MHEIVKRDHSKKKAAEQYFPVVLFILHKLVLTFESVDEILKCEHSSMKATKN